MQKILQAVRSLHADTQSREVVVSGLKDDEEAEKHDESFPRQDPFRLKSPFQFLVE